jgi:hypothetical protein
MAKAKKFKPEDRLPIRGTNFTHQDLTQWWEWLDASLRLGELYRYKATEEWLEQAPVFQKEFANLPEHVTAKTTFLGQMQTAYLDKLIDDEDFIDSQDFKMMNPYHAFSRKLKNLEVPDEITEEHYGEFWYIRHITMYLNIAGFSALKIIWEHCRGDVSELEEDKVYLQRINVRLSNIDTSKLSAKELNKIYQKITAWFYNLIRFYKANHDYLSRLVASVDVMRSDIDSNCKLSRGELAKKVAKSKNPENLKPSVITLHWRTMFLNEKYEIATHKRRRRDLSISGRKIKKQEVDNVLVFGEIKLADINSKMALAQYFIGKIDDLKNMLEVIHPRISEPEATLWKKRMNEFKVLKQTRLYWRKKLIEIGQNEVDDDKELEALQVDLLRNSMEKIKAYLTAGLLDDLQYIYDELKDSKVQDSQNLGTYEDFVRGLEAGLSGEVAPPANIPTEGEPSDDEKLIAEKLNSYDQAGLGISYSHLAKFYSCLKRRSKLRKRISNQQDVDNGDATKVGSQITYDHIWFESEHSDRFIEQVIYQDHAGSARKPIKAHPVWQDFLSLFPEKKGHWKEDKDVEVTWEDNDGKKHTELVDLKIKQGKRKMRGEPALVVAQWMLKNLPSATEERLKRYREDRLLQS